MPRQPAGSDPNTLRGRPPRDEAYGAARVVATVRLHAGEVSLVQRRQVSGGFATRSDLIREALGLPVLHPVRIERVEIAARTDQEQCRHLAQISNNLNQIARSLNYAQVVGDVPADLVREALAQLQRIGREVTT